MPTTVNNVKLKICNVNSIKCKTIKVNGVKSWSAETPQADLSAEVLNYNEYGQTASAKSSAAWNLSGFDRVALSWSLITEMSWPNAYGVRSTTSVYLQMADGTTVLLGSKTDVLFAAGSTYTKSGTANVDLTGYTDAQLRSVRMYVTLGNMNADVPTGNADRHNANASITGAVAS